MLIQPITIKQVRIIKVTLLHFRFHLSSSEPLVGMYSKGTCPAVVSWQKVYINDTFILRNVRILISGD